MAAILAFHAGKTVVQIAAIEVAIDYLLDIGPPESVLPGEMIVIDLDKGYKIVLHATVIIRILWVAGPAPFSARARWPGSCGRRSGEDRQHLIACRDEGIARNGDLSVL